MPTLMNGNENEMRFDFFGHVKTDCILLWQPIQPIAIRNNKIIKSWQAGEAKSHAFLRGQLSFCSLLECIAS